jgi:chlorite dismutase
MTVPGSEEFESAQKSRSNTFLNFSFFKIDPKWRWLNEIGKEEAAREFASLIEVANTKMKVRTYSTLGLREDADFMLWMISDSVEKMQILASKIYSTVLGKYIEATYVYLSAARQSVYSKPANVASGETPKHDGGTATSTEYTVHQRNKEGTIVPGFMTDLPPLKYAIVYPFVKSREWYLLPFGERRKMMEEHIQAGRQFPQVRLNTSYSFGLDDQDFMLAFETEDLMAFQELLMRLRETQVSRFVITDTPMIVCVYKGVEEIIKSLG